VSGLSLTTSGPATSPASASVGAQLAQGRPEQGQGELVGAGPRVLVVAVAGVRQGHAPGTRPTHGLTGGRRAGADLPNSPEVLVRAGGLVPGWT